MNELCRVTMSRLLFYVTKELVYKDKHCVQHKYSFLIKTIFDWLHRRIHIVRTNNNFMLNAGELKS